MAPILFSAACQRFGEKGETVEELPPRTERQLDYKTILELSHCVKYSPKTHDQMT